MFKAAAPHPTLSVTVTNYNYGRFLRQNIESILSQSFDDFELILVDNASTDNSVAIMRMYAARDPRMRIITHSQNEGMFASHREALALCRGRYRVHVDADDWVLSRDAFEVQVALLEQHPKMGFVFSSLTVVDGEGKVLTVSHPYQHDAVLSSDLAFESLFSFNLNHSGMMLRLDIFRSTAGYPEVYPQVSDQLLAVRLSERAELVGYINRSLYAFRQHGANVNLHPDLDVMKEQILPALQSAFDGPVGSRLAPAVKRRMMRRALVHIPTQYIFRGRPMMGWRLYWESLKLRPADTLFQRRTLSLVVRTLLGDRGFQSLLVWLGLGANSADRSIMTVRKPTTSRSK
jgi:glycosyltransferase involved in cell wall biosynthesis